jgi:hypothetical protein
MSLDEMNDKIAVKNPSKHDLQWNEDKTGVNRASVHVLGQNEW